MADSVQIVRDLLIDTLEDEFKVPVILNGSLSMDEELPEEYFTYFVNNTDNDRHYNNAAVRTVWDIDVNFYSTDPARTFSVLREAAAALEAEDFVITGPGHDIPVEDPELHTGQGMTVYFIERM